MLLKVHKAGLQIMETGFFYMPPFPLKYDVDNVKLLLNNTKSTRNCFTITTLSVVMIGIASAYVGLTFFLGYRSNASLSIATLQVLCSLAAFFAIFCVVLSWSQLSKSLLLNNLLSHCVRIFSRK